MATYLMFGRYSLDAVKEISAERTDKATALIKEHGGEFKSGYALLGENDLLLIVDLPDLEQAMKLSVALTKLLGISFSTSPAVTVEDFDRMMEEG
ncbi:MAG: GYD domain-containing protein [Anaerolineae bacterium]